MVAALLLLTALSGSPSDPTPATAPPEEHPAPPAEAHPTPPAEAHPASPPSPARPLPGDEDAADGFVDRSHAFLSRRLVEGVAWFDELFADERNTDFQRRGSALRWQNELRLESGGVWKPRTGLRLDLQVPELEGWFQRLRIIVYAQNITNESLLLPEDPASPLAVGDPGQTRAAGELRYEVLRALQSYVDVGVGLRAEVPPGVFLRARYRSTLALGLGALARFTTTAFYDSLLRLGSTGEATAERPIGRRLLLRWANLASISESRYDRGFEFATEASAAWAPAANRAYALAASAAGVTRPRAAVNAYRLAVRHRRDLWRRWLFVEVEPDLTWRRDEVTGAVHRVPGVNFRAEIYFDATFAPPLP